VIKLERERQERLQALEIARKKAEEERAAAAAAKKAKEEQKQKADEEARRRKQVASAQQAATSAQVVPSAPTPPTNECEVEFEAHLATIEVPNPLSPKTVY
jgi:hypothetical protein